MSAHTPIRQIPLHEEVAERLRSLIFDAHLPQHLAAGSWVDERALADLWGISKTPLREALKVLAGEGLVQLVPHRGCQVTQVPAEDIADLFDTMALLEGRCAALAIERLSPGGLLEIRALHQTLEQAAARRDLLAYYAANHVFHTRVQDLSGNRWLIRATEDVRKFVRLLRGKQLVVPGRLDASIGEHRDLLAAFEARDAARAETVMQGHLRAQCRAWQQLETEAAEHAQHEDASAHV